MKFGVREIVNVVFRAKNPQKIGSVEFKSGQPVFYIDSAKTSTLEGAATTVYAQGGRGNTRLISWEGEKTLTFTVEDALLSPVSFAMLSGAGLIKPVEGSTDDRTIHFHQTSMNVISADGIINLTDALESNESICKTAPLYILQVDKYGDLTGTVYDNFAVFDADTHKVGTTATAAETSMTGKALKYTGSGNPPTGAVMVDYYVLKNASTVSELQIDAEHFAGNSYVEADTLFRRQFDGKDLPANLTLPNVKIQSNFTFSMASTGDPSTFTFTMDALPGYTYFDTTKRVLCAIQIVDDKKEVTETAKTIFPHPAGTANNTIPESYEDSVAGGTKDSETDIAPDSIQVTLTSASDSVVQGETVTLTTVVKKNNETLDGTAQTSEGITLEYWIGPNGRATLSGSTVTAAADASGQITVTVNAIKDNKIIASSFVVINVTSSEDTNTEP